MYHDVHKIFLPLNELIDWKVDKYGVTCKKDADFCVRYYNIEIQNREVQNWTQPLFKATSQALFVLFTSIIKGERKFLITLYPEIGCFDKAEFGPTILLQNIKNLDYKNPLHKVFLTHQQKNTGIIKDVILSEEGGRFYHEQNRNVIIEVSEDEIPAIDKNTLWIDYQSLILLLINNNNLNIQLRNLMSLTEGNRGK